MQAKEVLKTSFFNAKIMFESKGENMDGNQENQNTNDNKDEKIGKTEEPLTLDEILEDDNYRSAFDKKMQNLRTKWEAEWKKKTEEQKKEAERLGAMSAEERLQEQIKKLEARERALNTKELKNETKKLLIDQNLPATFADFIVNENTKAEEVKEAINNLKDAYNNALNEEVKKKLAGETPSVGSKEQNNKGDYYKNLPRQF